jgi:hypothetical protein
MDTTPGPRRKPVYPLRPPRHDDERFTAGLVGDISEVLARHGFPPLATSNDVLCFSNALHAIIYQEH